MSETIEATLPDPIDVRNIPCERIDDPESFRQDPGDLADLAASIRELGLLQPIVVTPSETRYLLLAGRRRLAAHHLLKREFICALVIPVESSRPIEIQCDENVHRKMFHPMEAVRIARRLRPLMQAAAEQRRQAGTKAEGQAGNTRELVARRVGLSHETLKRAEYVLDHSEAITTKLEEVQQAGAAPQELQDLAAKLQDLVERLESSDKARRLTIAAAYKQALALLRVRPSRGSSSSLGLAPHVVRIATDVISREGKRIGGAVVIELALDEVETDDPPTEWVLTALQTAIQAVTRGDMA
jgi:ParB/RepB/Spo0J family partition protein